MKATHTTKALTLGGLIAAFYDVYGERNAKGILRLVFKTNLVAFRGSAHSMEWRVNGKT